MHKSTVYATPIATATGNTRTNTACTFEPFSMFSFTMNSSSTAAIRNMMLKSAK